MQSYNQLNIIQTHTWRSKVWENIILEENMETIAEVWESTTYTCQVILQWNFFLPTYAIKLIWYQIHTHGLKKNFNHGIIVSWLCHYVLCLFRVEWRYWPVLASCILFIMSCAIHIYYIVRHLKLKSVADFYVHFFEHTQKIGAWSYPKFSYSFEE